VPPPTYRLVYILSSSDWFLGQWILYALPVRIRFWLALSGLLIEQFYQVFNKSSYVLHKKRSHVPPGWTLIRRQDASEYIPLRFGLKQSNISRLVQHLYDVSHPESPNYGKHWTLAQVAKVFAPDKKSIDAVRSWLLERVEGEGEGFAKSRVDAGEYCSWRSRDDFKDQLNM